MTIDVTREGQASVAAPAELGNANIGVQYGQVC